MDTHFSIHNTQTISQFDARQQEEIETNDDRPNTVVRLIVAANFYTIIAVVLVLLRAIGRIDWSWGSATAPLWVPILLTGVLIAIFGLANMVITSFNRSLQ